MGTPGHKEFTLKAGEKEGRCIFRIALSRQPFKGFKDKNGLLNLIEIPLKIASGKD